MIQNEVLQEKAPPSGGRLFFKVTLNRILCLMLLFLGLVFFWFGLELGFLHRFFGPEDINPENRHLLWIFIPICLVGSSVVVLNLAYYLVFPPSLMEVTSEGISFGTGFRYNQFLIPWKYVRSAGYGLAVTTSNLNAGLRVEFAKSDEIPHFKVTSAGVIYVYHVLVLNRFYMAQSAAVAIAAVEEGVKRFGAGAPKT